MEITSVLQTLCFLTLTYFITANLDYFGFLPVAITINFFGYAVVFVIVFNCISIVFKKYFFNQRASPENKAVLITGCDTGFGHMLTKKLHHEGYKVFASCYFPTGDGAKELQKLGPNVHVFGLDVTKSESVSKALEYVHQNLGNSELWAVVNNAGIFNLVEIEFINEEDYQRMFDVNSLGVARVTKAFLPLLRKSRGRVVTVTSLAGRVSFHYTTSYCMSKFATTAFCECLRQEMDPWGIKVVTIEPELYRTGMTDPDGLLKIMGEAWDKCAEEIKLEYGEMYMKQWQSTFRHLLGLGCKTPQQVIDCMFDAVSLLNPDYAYKPRSDILRRFAVFCLQYQPKIITDFEIRLVLRLAGRPFPVTAKN